MNETAGVTRLTRLLPIACLAAAICLFASELMTMFELTPPGGEAQDVISNAERHGNAMFVIAAFAVGALAVAVFGGSKPAAIAVAGMGLSALLFFLLGDLPDAGQVGTLDTFFSAETVPKGGFWMLLVSSLALSITGIALATLSPEQLIALSPRRWRERGIDAGSGQGDDPSEAATASTTAHESPAAEETQRLPRRRPRTRQRG